MSFKPKSAYFGLRGGWLQFWLAVTCGVEMTLYGYDQVRLEFRDVFRMDDG